MARRRSFVPVLLVAALALAIGGVAWFALSDTTPPRPLAKHAASEVAAAPASTLEPSPPSPDAAPAPQNAVERTASSTERAAVTERDDTELANAIWVEGHVRFPEGMPIGERVEVIADGKKFEHRDDYRSAVETDGHFRVAFSAETKSGWLKLDAPHLFVEPFKVKVGALPDDITLEPQVGGEITGTIVPPAGADDVAKVLEKTRVTLNGWDRNSQQQIVRVSAIDENLHYDLRGIPAHLDYRVSVEPDAWAPTTRDSIRVEQGKTRELELAITLGARVNGRIVDAGDAPVTGCVVRAEIRREAHGVESRQIKLEKNGAFAARGILPGKVTLVATKNGYVDARVDLGALSDGDVRDDVIVRLESGNFVAGRVTWPEGSPAAGAFVRVIEPKDGEARDYFVMNDDQGTKVDANGDFRITGLGNGPYEVWAQAREGRRPETGPDGQPVKKSHGTGPLWRAHAEEIASGTQELALVLQPGLVVEGRVVDETQAPVAKFTVVANETSEGLRFSNNDTVTAKVEAADGRFQLQGLREGTWSVIAKAEGFTSNQPSVVQVPGDGSELTLTLAHCATLIGLVVDGSGKPVAKATVRADTRQGDYMWYGNDADSNATTNEDGVFEIDDAPSGALAIEASHPSFAGSEPLALTVAAGQRIEAVTVVLKKGGSIRGELHASLGEDLAGWGISLNSNEGNRGWQHATTDDAGGFVFERVTPGKYTVRGQPPDAESKVVIRGGVTTVRAGAPSTRRPTALVTVVEGDTARVVLGALAKEPILVSGRVSLAGKPGSDFQVSTWQPQGQSSATTGADGRYELTVDGAGDYTFTAGHDGGGTQLVHHVKIPETASFTVDFDFEASHIAGRVLGADGKPLAEAWVQLQPDRSRAERSSNAVHGWMRTGADGAFNFDGLSSGVYEVSVTDIGARRFGVGPEHGLARVGDLQLEDGRSIDGLEIRLETAASIEGIVRTSAGTPAIGARVAVRDEHGEVARNWWSTASDGAGHYRVDGLSPGAWSVSAMLGSDVSEESEQVQLAPGSKATVDLALRSGTVLSVVIEDADGKVVGGALSVRDSRGREYATHTFRPSTPSGESSPGQRVGPLAPGTYEVSATNHDGVRASQNVSLHGQAEQSVTLRLGGS